MLTRIGELHGIGHWSQSPPGTRNSIVIPAKLGSCCGVPFCHCETATSVASDQSCARARLSPWHEKASENRSWRFHDVYIAKSGPNFDFKHIPCCESILKLLQAIAFVTTCVGYTSNGGSASRRQHWPRNYHSWTFSKNAACPCSAAGDKEL